MDYQDTITTKYIEQVRQLIAMADSDMYYAIENNTLDVLYDSIVNTYKVASNIATCITKLNFNAYPFNFTTILDEFSGLIYIAQARCKAIINHINVNIDINVFEKDMDDINTFKQFIQNKIDNTIYFVNELDLIIDKNHIKELVLHRYQIIIRNEDENELFLDDFIDEGIDNVD